MVDPRLEEAEVLKRIEVFSKKIHLLIIELEQGDQIELNYINFKWEYVFNARTLSVRAIAKQLRMRKLMAHDTLIPYEPLNREIKW